MTSKSKKSFQLSKTTLLTVSSKNLVIEKNINDQTLKSEYKAKGVNGYQLKLEKKDIKEAWWAFAGFFIAVVIWQISSSPIIAIVGSIILSIISLFLIIDYIFSSEKIKLIFFISGNRHEEIIDKENLNEVKDFLSTSQISE